MSKGETDQEFLPLPYFGWVRRPSHIRIEDDEAATALYLAGGEVEVAAGKLRVEPLRLQRAINRSGRLQRLHAELTALLNDKVHHEYVRAFESEDDRRREWAASKVSQTKQFQGHPLAPNTNVATSVSIDASGAKEIVFRWRTDADDAISTTYEEKKSDDAG